MKTTNGARLERVNLMLEREESEWLDKLAQSIKDQTGAKVSRSEIVRAAIAGLRELHRLAPESQSRLFPLDRCRSGSDLAMLAVIASRAATDARQLHTRTASAQPERTPAT